MANPKELQEAADAIREVRRLPAVQRHRELEDLLQRAEEWARREYLKVSEGNDDRSWSSPAWSSLSTEAKSISSDMDSRGGYTLVFAFQQEFKVWTTSFLAG